MTVKLRTRAEETGALDYALLQTPMGWVGILASEGGLLATSLPQPTPEQARLALGPAAVAAQPDVRCLLGIIKRLSDYFEGKKVDFPDTLRFEGSTHFQRRVWEATRRIPYGETRTYLDIARQVSSPRAARAVGQALGANPLPIIVPCHRVIASDGGFGGFGGGVEMKRRLLEMESSGHAV